MAGAAFNLPKELSVSGDLAENWRQFRQSLEIFLLASGLTNTDSERKLAILLNVIGEDGLKIYNNFNLSNATYENVLEEFQRYCEPKRNILHARYIFQTRKQEVGEPFDNFLNDVKKLAKNCNFGSFEDEAVRDRLIFGSCDTEIQNRIIFDSTDEFKLEEAIRRLRVAEISRKQSQILHKDSEVAIHKVHAKKYSEQDVVNCRWCGQTHKRKLELCPARGKICQKCKKMNHFSSVCRTKVIKEVTQEDGEDENLFINSVSKNVNRICLDWSQNLLLENSVLCNFKLDTGADVNLIPYHVYKKLSKNKNIKLSKSKYKLVAYNKTGIKTYGSIVLEVKIKDRSILIDFIITTSGFQPTLGRDSCILLGLVERKYVDSIDIEANDIDKQKIISNYSNVFTGIGCFPNQCQILLKKGSEPVSKPPHRLPLRLKEKLKKELDPNIVEPHNNPRSFIIKDVQNGNLLRRNTSQLKPSYCLTNKNTNEPTLNNFMPIENCDMDNNVRLNNCIPIENCDMDNNVLPSQNINFRTSAQNVESSEDSVHSDFPSNNYIRPKRSVKVPSYLKDYVTNFEGEDVVS
ncbi:hypothetical protein ACJJTC_006938 [Scirpophaga incertulas]